MTNETAERLERLERAVFATKDAWPTGYDSLQAQIDELYALTTVSSDWLKMIQVELVKVDEPENAAAQTDDEQIIEIKSRMLKNAIAHLMKDGMSADEARALAMRALQSPVHVKLPTLDELDTEFPR